MRQTPAPTTRIREVSSRLHHRVLELEIEFLWVFVGLEAFHFATWRMVHCLRHTTRTTTPTHFGLRAHD